MVSDVVVKQLRDRGMSVVRLGGSTRYSTAAKVAQEIAKHRTVTAAVIAGGDGIVDAVSASGPAAALREPILLTPASSLAWSTESQLKAMGVKYIHIVGGTPVVGQKVEDKLKASYTVRRLSGADRYATSAAVAGYFRGQIASTEMVITAGSDASLVDSLVAGTRQRLMVLVTPDVAAGDGCRDDAAHAGAGAGHRGRQHRRAVQRRPDSGLAQLTPPRTHEGPRTSGALRASPATRHTACRQARSTANSGSVFSRTSSSVTPGASSRSTRPSSVTSKTHRSVMMRCTTPRPV